MHAVVDKAATAVGRTNHVTKDQHCLSLVVMRGAFLLTLRNDNELN